MLVDNELASCQNNISLTSQAPLRFWICLSALMHDKEIINFRENAYIVFISSLSEFKSQPLVVLPKVTTFQLKALNCLTQLWDLKLFLY